VGRGGIRDRRGLNLSRASWRTARRGLLEILHASPEQQRKFVKDNCTEARQLIALIEARKPD